MKRIKKYIKYLVVILLVYLLLCFTTPFNKYLRNRSIENQINYLSQILDQGYDDQLQSRFPEGKVFSNSLLALSIIEHCNKTENCNSVYAKTIDQCIQRLLSENSLKNLHKGDSLDLRYIFKNERPYINDDPAYPANIYNQENDQSAIQRR